MSQFFYKTYIPEGEGKDKKEIEISFNIEKVLATVSTKEGGIRVMLDDWHEHSDREKVSEGKNGKAPTYRTVKFTINTEFMLDAEDANRFKSITEVDVWRDELVEEEIEHKKNIEEFISKELDGK